MINFETQCYVLLEIFLCSCTLNLLKIKWNSHSSAAAAKNWKAIQIIRCDSSNSQKFRNHYMLPLAKQKSVRCYVVAPLEVLKLAVNREILSTYNRWSYNWSRLIMFTVKFQWGSYSLSQTLWIVGNIYHCTSKFYDELQTLDCSFCSTVSNGRFEWIKI